MGLLTILVACLAAFAGGTVFGYVVATLRRATRQPTAPPYPDPRIPTEGFPPGLGSQPSANFTTPQDERLEIVDLLRRGKKIAAIKRYREQTDAGLADAKAAVEDIERTL